MRFALTFALSILGFIAFIVFGTASPAGGQPTTVVIGDNWYCEASFENGVCETTIDAGTTVLWDYASGNTVHTVTECGDSLDDCNPPSRLWHSGSLASGQTFSRTFDTVGTFLYRCQIHPQQMRGRIVVQEALEATSTVAPLVTPTAEPTAVTTAEPIATTAPADSPAAAGEASATPTPVVEGAVALPVGGGSPPGAGSSSYVWLVAAGGSFLIIALGAASVVVSRQSRR